MGENVGASPEPKPDKESDLKQAEKEHTSAMEVEDLDLGIEEEKMEVDEEKMEAEEEQSKAIYTDEEETSIENVSLRKASVSSEETAGSTMEEGRDELDNLSEMPNAGDQAEATMLNNRDGDDSSRDDDE